MARMIENLENAFEEMFDFITDLPSGLDGFESDFDTAFSELAKVKSDNVLEVVRCKDCKWFVYDMDLNHETYPNAIEADGLCQITDKYCDMPHFCSYGERREENGES